MGYLIGIANAGLVAVLQYPVRSIATVGCVLAILVPYLTGAGLSHGLEQQAEDSVRLGADLYVSGEQFGKNAALPAALASEIKKIDGVTRVVPRIVARVVIGKNHEEAVLVGMPLEHFPADVGCVEGDLPRSGTMKELVLGTELARRLGLRVGSYIPPFYHNPNGDLTAHVVGIFKADLPMWQANVMLCSLATASYICNQEGKATDLLVWCRPEYEANVRRAILQASLALPSGPKAPGAGRPERPISLRVTGRAELNALLPTGIIRRDGLFNLHFVIVFTVGILTILVTSGFGTSERRREIGILKATGWQTDEVLLRCLVESLLLTVTGAAVAIILAYVWLRLLNGYWIAGVFIPGVDVKPGFRVPFSLAPVPVLLAFLLAAVLVMVGSLYTTWRAAIVPPREAMR